MSTESKEDKINKEIDTVCAQLQEIFDKFPEMELNILYDLMIQLIDKFPENLHKIVMMRFTFMLGRYLKLTDEETYQIFLEEESKSTTQ